MAARGRGASLPPGGGQHFLRSPRLADEIVAAAGVRPDELVLEIGPGFGRLTAPLLAAGARVVAVELDPGLAAALRRRHGGPRLRVVEGDFLGAAQPQEPHRVLGNIPFAITTSVLHRLLDDPQGPVERVELIVQDGFARKRVSARPTTLLALGWLPWWRLEADRHLPAACFDPPPAVDAALLSVRRRRPVLLDPDRAAAYRALLRAGFTRDARPVRRALCLAPRAWKRFARDRGLRLDARPHELDVWDWVALFRMTQSGRACARESLARPRRRPGAER